MARLHAKRCSRYKSKEKEEFLVEILIGKSENIERDNMGQNGLPRIYQVFGSLGPGIEFETCEAHGKPDPVWKWVETIEVDRISGLDLEIDMMRLGSKLDPGTSTGKVSVGRAKIILPNIYNEYIPYRVELVKSLGENLHAEAHLTILVMIERFKSTDNGMWKKV